MYIRRVRNREYDRLRHSTLFIAWLIEQATRLATTAEIVFSRLLSGESAADVEAITDTYPANTVAPAITGTTTEGETLTADDGSWTGNPDLTRQWLRDGVEIEGETASTYLLAAADVDTKISVRVTGSNALDSVVATSAETDTIAAAA